MWCGDMGWGVLWWHGVGWGDVGWCVLLCGEVGWGGVRLMKICIIHNKKCTAT